MANYRSPYPIQALVDELLPNLSDEWQNIVKTKIEPYLVSNTWGMEDRFNVQLASDYDAFVDPNGTFTQNGGTPIYKTVAEAINALTNRGKTVQYICLIPGTAIDSQAIISSSSTRYIYVSLYRGDMNQLGGTNVGTWDMGAQAHTFSSANLTLEDIDLEYGSTAYTVGSLLARRCRLGTNSSATFRAGSSVFIGHQTNVGIYLRDCRVSTSLLASTGTDVILNNCHVTMGSSDIAIGNDSSSGNGLTAFQDTSVYSSGTSRTLTVEGQYVSIIGPSNPASNGGNTYTISVTGTGITFASVLWGAFRYANSASLTLDSNISRAWVGGIFNNVTLNNNRTNLSVTVSGTLTVNGTNTVGTCVGTYTNNGGSTNQVVTTTGVTPNGTAGGALDGTYPNPGLAASVAGAGLAESSDVLSVNVDNNGIEINSDTLRLKDSGVTSSTYGDATHVPQIGVDAKGRITTASNVLITGVAPGGSAGGALDGTYPNPGLAASVAGAGLAETSDVLSVNVDNSTLEINTDTLRIKADGVTSNEIHADAVGPSELQATAVAAGTYGDSTNSPQITIDADGRITAASNQAIAGAATPDFARSFMTMGA